MQFFYQFPQRVERLVLISSGGLGHEVSPMLRTATLPGISALLSLAIHPRLLGALWETGRRLRQRDVRAGVYLQAIARALRPLETAGAREAFLQTLRAVIDVHGQRVSATDRLYLLESIPTMIVWGERDNTIPLPTDATRTRRSRTAVSGRCHTRRISRISRIRTACLRSFGSSCRRHCPDGSKMPTGVRS